MTIVYLICFLLIAIGAVLVLGLTPDGVSEDLMHFTASEQTLRDKVLVAKEKKKSRKLTVSLNRIKDALESTGKGSHFTVACAASLVLMILGCVVAVAIDNLLLIPVFAIAFALIPFAFAKRTINYYGATATSFHTSINRCRFWAIFCMSARLSSVPMCI